ncbi:hypothetical protein CE142_003252 [Salmonella enterica]|nr:hypothetical protein [Salmonella enterica]
MLLNTFPVTGPVQNQADWIELKCLSDEFNFMPVADIRSAIELQDDYQDDDIAREDGEVEAEIDSILREISSRKEHMNDTYPFQIEDGGSVVSLIAPIDELAISQKVYLYCLIFSHIFNSPLLIVDGSPLPADRDILQICATIAAAGYVRGHSISFGFPRRDHSSFYDKAVEVVNLLGEGELHPLKDVNPVHSLSPKDSGIDVITWEDSHDKRAGKRIYFSQVASGRNWRDKPVLHYIDIFRNYWLRKPILSRINDAIFIPYEMMDDIDNHYTAEQLLESQLSTLGTIFYRRRIPVHFKEGIQLKRDNDNLSIERIDECNKISDYVDNKINLLKTLAI